MDPCLSRCKGRESLRTLVLKLSAPCPRNTIAMPEVVWQLLKLLWASASHSPKKEKMLPPILYTYFIMRSFTSLLFVAKESKDLRGL